MNGQKNIKLHLLNIKKISTIFFASLACILYYTFLLSEKGKSNSESRIQLFVLACFISVPVFTIVTVVWKLWSSRGRVQLKCDGTR